jgi:hypothetical protein
MKHESENLTAQQSLDIITSMIRQTKGNARQNSFHFLLWGWIVVLANLGMYTLNYLEYERPYIVWLITIPAWFLSFYVGCNRQRRERVFTHYDLLHLSLWLSFGVCIFTIVAFGYKLNFQINPLILTLSSIPTFLSGILMRFRPFMVGGICFWIFGVIGFLTPVEFQPLVGAVAVSCGYLIPGYMLRAKKSEDTYV